MRPVSASKSSTTASGERMQTGAPACAASKTELKRSAVAFASGARPAAAPALEQRFLAAADVRPTTPEDGGTPMIRLTGKRKLFERFVEVFHIPPMSITESAPVVTRTVEAETR